MNIVYLLLGANLGDRHHQLSQAIDEIEKHIGEVVDCSSIYETAAWGIEEQPSYFNQVLLVETVMEPYALLTTIHEIEHRLGRVRFEKWGARMIDIDILFYSDLVLDEEMLTIPHPLLHTRKFTLLPLAELTAELFHPVLGKTVDELLLELSDPLEVKKLE